MDRMDRRTFLKMAALTTAMLMGVCPVFAEEALRPVLLVQLPEDAQMVENVEFDDGDFIQTYQLSGGMTVQLVRYAHFDMNLQDMIVSEWTGASDIKTLDMQQIGGRPADGARFAYTEMGEQRETVTLVLVTAGSDTLVFQAIAPQDDAQAERLVQQMLNTMDVQGEERGAPMPDVG